MNEKGSVRTVLVRRKDVEELLEQFNEHAHSSWSDWLGTRIRELPTLTVKGELRLQGHDASSDPGDDLNEVVVRTLRSIARSLDQLTKNLRSQLEDGHTTKEQKTNGDWLRSMTDEGLLEALACEWPCHFYDGDCPDIECRNCIETWLKSPKGCLPFNPWPKEGEIEMTDMAKVKELGARITVKCNKCGKTAPIDKERSTENWTVYKMGKPCECGGKFVTVPIIRNSNGKM